MEEMLTSVEVAYDDSNPHSRDAEEMDVDAFKKFE